MKINNILLIISVAICLLIAYGFFVFSSTNNLVLSLGSFVTIIIPATLLLAISPKNSKIRLNVKIISGLFFALFIIIHIIFTFFTSEIHSISLFINGLLFLVFITVVYKLFKINDV